jgi:hypothetical protein
MKGEIMPTYTLNMYVEPTNPEWVRWIGYDPTDDPLVNWLCECKALESRLEYIKPCGQRFKATLDEYKAYMDPFYVSPLCPNDGVIADALVAGTIELKYVGDEARYRVWELVPISELESERMHTDVAPY